MTEPTEAFNRRDLEALIRSVREQRTPEPEKAPSEKVDDRSSTTGRTWRRHDQPATGVE